MVAFSPPPYCQEEELCLPTLVTQFLADGCNKLDTPLSRHRKIRMHYSMPQSCVGRILFRATGLIRLPLDSALIEGLAHAFSPLAARSARDKKDGFRILGEKELN